MTACQYCGRPHCKQCERERAMEEFWGVPEDHIDDAEDIEGGGS